LFLAFDRFDPLLGLRDGAGHAGSARSSFRKAFFNLSPSHLIEVR
jgi:hypothetical protein